MIEGSVLNFVEGSSHFDSFISGGGRDFVWNEDGSIATKLNPNLVLGKAFPKIVLVHQDSSQKLVLEHAEELANRKTVPMMLVKNGASVSKRYNETREFGPWHYVESQVANDDAVSIRFDGNFILVDGEEFALGVSFWNMEEGTPVNLVGGDDRANGDKMEGNTVE